MTANVLRLGLVPIELNKLVTNKLDYQIMENINEKEENKALSQDAVISRFLVAYDKELEQNVYMETVWTNFELAERWTIISEHNSKEEARLSCVNLNGL